MSEEKPLHVRVAEALGWTEIHEAWPRTEFGWCGRPSKEHEAPWNGRFLGSGCDLQEHGRINHFNNEWGAVGPLIEKYLVIIGPTWTDDAGAREVCGTPVGRRALYWSAWTHFPEARIDRDGPTPLVAVCNLILALKSAGKLEIA